MWNFDVTLRSAEALEGMVSTGLADAVSVGFPADFGGDAERWSPEALLSASVASCLMTSFRYFLHRSNGDIQSFSNHARATLDKTEQGLRITRVGVAVDIWVADSVQEGVARKAAEKAQKACAVSHSLNCPVDVEWIVHHEPL